VLGALPGSSSDKSIKGSVRRQPSNVNTLWDQSTSSLVFQVIFLRELSETPVLTNVDLLSAWKLKLSSSKGLDSNGGLLLLSSDRHQHLSNINSGSNHGWLTESSSHTCLESISTSTRKHLVDSDNVVWVSSDSQVEEILTSNLDHVLVASNTGSFKGLGSDLLQLIRNEVNSRWECVARSSLVTDVEDTKLGVRDTSAVSGLGVRLVLAVAIAASWSSTHSETNYTNKQRELNNRTNRGKFFDGFRSGTQDMSGTVESIANLPDY